MPLQYHVVSRDDAVYEAFPDLLLLPDGSLLCVFTECDRHAPRGFSRLVVTKSFDQGRTWGPKRLLPLEGKLKMCDCARLSWLDERVYLVCGAEDAVRGGSCFFSLLSSDLGESWEGPFIHPLEGIMPDKPVRTADGRTLLPAQRRKKDEPNQEEEILYTSYDGGLSYDLRPTVVASVPGLWLCEGNFLDLGQGILACILRENSGEGYDGYKALSFDGGLSWGPAHRMPLPGLHRASSGLLQDGSVLITYRFMQGGQGWLGNWTQNAFAALTSRESLLENERRKQWSRIMPLFYDRSPKSDLGYTSFVQFADGEIYVVSYLVDDAPKAYIKGVSFCKEDMLLPG